MHKLKSDKCNSFIKIINEKEKPINISKEWPPTSIIIDAFRNTKYQYLAIFAKPCVVTEHGKVFEIIEAVYLTSSFPIEMIKFYNKINYWRACINEKHREYENAIIGVYSVTEDESKRFVYRDLTQKFIKLSKENERYEVHRGFIDSNKSLSNYNKF